MQAHMSTTVTNQTDTVDGATADEAVDVSNDEIDCSVLIRGSTLLQLLVAHVGHISVPGFSRCARNAITSSFVSANTSFGEIC